MNAPSEKILLTIGIPTYNRKASLIELLNLIANTKFPCACEVLVINNGNHVQIDNCIVNLQTAGHIVNVIKNKTNCGGQENALRIYEHAQGEYVWYLGDDDRFYAEKISLIFQALAISDVDCILFDSTAVSHPVPRFSTGPLSEVQVLGGEFPLRKLMFAPLAIIRRSALTQALSLARLHLGCFAPQLLLILLGNIRNFYYIRETLIHADNVPVSRSERLSLLPVFLGIGRLPDIGLPPQKQRLVRKLLISEWRVFTRPAQILGGLAVDRIQGIPIAIMPYIRAGFSNYPLWLALTFPVSLLLLKLYPGTWLIATVSWFSNKIYKKDIDVYDFTSKDRI